MFFFFQKKEEQNKKIPKSSDNNVFGGWSSEREAKISAAAMCLSWIWIPKKENTFLLSQYTLSEIIDLPEVEESINNASATKFLFVVSSSCRLKNISYNNQIKATSY